MPPLRFFLQISVSQRGLSVTEFGLIAPILAVMLMGVLDMGHTLYMQSVLQGAMQKAARDASLETGTQSSIQAAIDASVTDQVQKLARAATVTISRNNFRDYSKAATPAMEPFTDTNGNGTCNGGEPYEDSNNSGSWDTDNGRTGQGGAQDNVVYVAKVVYPRLFPLMRMVGLPVNVTLNASTALINQPYGDQASVTIRNCP
ncbi:TadE/TadG family type IV pilus assembly protein [Sphingobium sp. AN558]|uniref:TadE/TadG family type IV pilus assembly protein n=1 Tax=Sphingobium sp. AN558 TaxID=3133442 RepID=UPI0030C376B7